MAELHIKKGSKNGTYDPLIAPDLAIGIGGIVLQKIKKARKSLVWVVEAKADCFVSDEKDRVPTRLCQNVEPINFCRINFCWMRSLTRFIGSMTRFMNFLASLMEKYRDV